MDCTLRRYWRAATLIVTAPLFATSTVFAVLLTLIAAPAWGTQVTGSLQGGHGTAQFTCLGSPTCTGTVVLTLKGNQGGCSNSFTYTTAITFTGFDLTGSSFSGTLGIGASQNNAPNPDGTCTYTLGPGQTTMYTGTWNAATGSGALVINDFDKPSQSPPFPGSFTASVSSSPVFPMTVNGSVTTTTTDVGATIQPRTQDVGTSASIFVFAHAPSNLVMGATPPKRAPAAPPMAASSTADAIVCVLAQVNANGQLVAVSASTMQAYLTGVLTSQNQAVTILNNVATPNVAGATVYVGYGTSAASMFASGVYQTAIAIPGGVQCTASLASAPAPNSPGGLTGLWWNANESGWGIHFTQRGNNVFAAWYTYDAVGNPKWYVASNCAGASGTSGICSGTLYQVNGPAFFGVDFNSRLVNVVPAGSLQVNFQSANNASMTYTVGTQTRTVAITRQPLGTGTTIAAVDYSDLWWNPNESGWGMVMAQQFGNIFLAWYVYGSDGKPIWYVASNCVVSGSSCSGTLYRTTGPVFGPTFDSTQIHVFSVGSAIVSFVDANNAVLSYTVDGVSATKTITRQLF